MRNIIWLWLFVSLTMCGGLVAQARSATGEQGAIATATVTTTSHSAQEAALMPVEPMPTPMGKAKQRIRPSKPPMRPSLPVSGMPPGVSHKAPLDQTLETLVQAGQLDLAGRQGVAVEAITRVEVRSVVWSDGSLGCPRPGMAYPQAEVDGLFVRFRLGERNFDYHGGIGRALFLCDQKPSGGNLTPPPGGDS